MNGYVDHKWTITLHITQPPADPVSCPLVFGLRSQTCCSRSQRAEPAQHSSIRRYQLRQDLITSLKSWNKDSQSFSTRVVLIIQTCRHSAGLPTHTDTLIINNELINFLFLSSNITPVPAATQCAQLMKKTSRQTVSWFWFILLDLTQMN